MASKPKSKPRKTRATRPPAKPATEAPTEAPTEPIEAPELPDPATVGTDLVATMARAMRWAGRESTITVPVALTRVLSQLDEFGPSRISTLAATDRCAQPTMSVLVQRLEERDWVVREPDPTDSRASLISLNPAGRRALQQARAAAGSRIAAYLTAQGEDEVRRAADAVALLRRLLAHDAPSRTSA